MTPALEAATDRAVKLFQYREAVLKQSLPHDPDWARVMGESLKPAISGMRGDTDQQQCAYQAIRLTMWESGWFRAPWGKAFAVALVTRPLPWHRRWWQWLLKLFNDLF
jgi:hypothetical protein